MINRELQTIQLGRIVKTTDAYGIRSYDEREQVMSCDAVISPFIPKAASSPKFAECSYTAILPFDKGDFTGMECCINNEWKYIVEYQVDTKRHLQLFLKEITNG